MAPQGDALMVVGLLAAGVGGIFMLTDRRSPSSRALALCLLAMALRLLLAPLDPQDPERTTRWFLVLTRGLEAGAIIAGIEWGRRIGQGATDRLRRTVNALFRVSQLMTLVYAGLMLGYVVLFPQSAATELSGLTRLSGAEWAVFAPVLGTALLLSAIAILMLLITRTDPAESVRLRALFLAAPFLIAGLYLGDHLVAVSVAVGLLIFLAGSVRYLVIQGQRGQFMSQFLSPELSRLMRQQGMERVLQRQRLEISAVVCDVRGFTAFALRTGSEEVAGLLERYYREAGVAAAEFGGMVKDHAGDGILILAGAPLPAADHARRATRIARALMTRVRPLLQHADPTLGLGVGVASGIATVGAIQGAGRLEYVAVGTPVNLASRLAERAGDGEVLMGGDTADALEAPEFVTRPLQFESLKSFDAPVPVHALLVPSDP